MYLNITLLHIGDDMTMFNYNMGCIWIADCTGDSAGDDSLTITWDVFEYAQPYKMETRDGV